MDVVHLGKMLDAVRDVRAATAQLEQELLTALAVTQSHRSSEELNRTSPDEWMTQVELADWLKISRTTVWRLIRKGGIPVHRIGRTVRVRRSDVERWLVEEGDGAWR